MKLQDLVEARKVIKPGTVVNRHKYEGSIDISFADITKLSKDAIPRHVGVDFLCNNTKIKSLVGSPEHVGRDFQCYYTDITSVKGAPKHIGRDWQCHNTPIKSLHNIHKEVKHIGRVFLISARIESHILGVMLIKGLERIKIDSFYSKHKEVEAIINKYLSGSRDPHACQEEMIESGLGEYAQL